MASFSIGSITDSSCRVSVSIDSSYPYWRVFCRLADDSSDVTYDTGNVSRSGNFSVTITGLDPETRYVVNVGYSTVPQGCVWLGGKYFTTTEPVPSFDIDPWSWASSNGSATATQTKNAHAVLQGNLPAGNFSYKVWNDFVDKVAEVRLSVSNYGQDWDEAGGVYLPKNECKVSAGDSLSANIYNAVRYNVGSLISTGIADVSPGDEITGYHIIRLSERLNDYIDTL